MSRWVVTIGVLLVLFPGVLAARGSSAGATRACTTSQLTIRLVRSFAGLGESGGYIGFTNRSSAACHLSGWPTVIATRVGRSTPAKHIRTTQFGPSPKLKGVPDVTLRHGATAEVVFVAADNPGPGKTTCAPPYRRLRITPPGNSRGVVLSAWIPYLDAYLPACSGVSVTMVVTAAAIRGS